MGKVVNDLGGCIDGTVVVVIASGLHASSMKLPIPNAEEVEAMRALYASRFGVDLTPQEAFEALSNIVHFIYLTEYYDPLHPLRPKKSGGRGEATAIHRGPDSDHDRECPTP
jgi:hypothetical protein